MIFKWTIQWFLLKPGVQTIWVIKLNTSKTGFLLVLLPLDFYSVLMHFMKLPCLSEKNWAKKPEGAVCNFSRAKVCGGSSSPCALGRLLLRSWDSSHQGGLSSSHQHQAWRSSVTQKQGRDVLVPNLPYLQKRGGIFHVILFSCAHMPRKYS